MKYDLLMLNITRDGSYVSPGFRESIGQHLIASYVNKHDFKAKTYAGYATGCKLVIENEIQVNQVDNIGLYCSCDNYNIVRNIVIWLKTEFRVNVFVGGPQAVALKEKFLRETNCDAVVVGEGEAAVLELLEYYVDGYGSLRRIGNLRFIDGQYGYVENDIREPIKDLDAIPFPDMDNSLNQRYKTGDSIGIITGRGCPYACAFCYEGAHSKNVRYRSLDNVFKEIDEMMVRNPNIKFLCIYDDTFTLDPDRVHEFCKRMRKMGKKLNWFCEGHVQTLLKNPDMIEDMISSGLVSMQIGIESGSRRVLEAYKKQITPQMIIDVVKLCKKFGLASLTGNFIVGGAFETLETLNESIALAKELIRHGVGMLECRTVFLALYPDTPMSSNPEGFGIYALEEQNKKSVVTMHNSVVRTKALARNDIIKLKKQFDRVIAEEYRKQAKKADKQTVLSCFKIQNKEDTINSVWKSTFLSFRHIKNFLEIAEEDRKCRESCGREKIRSLYPVRTFELLEYDRNEALCLEGLKFTGMEKLILENAVGACNLEELSGICGTDAETVERVCEKLNDRCLLYYSNF